MKRSAICAWVLLCSAALGCGGPARPTTAPVRGVVTLDGQPIGGASVMFMPVEQGRPALGTTDDNGKFELMTFKPGDGALLGEHKVTVTLKKLSGVTSADGLSGSVDAGGPKEEWVTPARYADPATSGLTATVDVKTPPVEFKLTK